MSCICHVNYLVQHLHYYTVLYVVPKTFTQTIMQCVYDSIHCQYTKQIEHVNQYIVFTISIKHEGLKRRYVAFNADIEMLNVNKNNFSDK